MSKTITAVLINLLSMLLPWLGVSVGDAALLTTIQTLVAVTTGLWIWYERYKKGGITPLGLRAE